MSKFALFHSQMPKIPLYYKAKILDFLCKKVYTV